MPPGQLMGAQNVLQPRQAAPAAAPSLLGFLGRRLVSSSFFNIVLGAELSGVRPHIALGLGAASPCTGVRGVLSQPCRQWLSWAWSARPAVEIAHRDTARSIAGIPGCRFNGFSFFSIPGALLECFADVTGLSTVAWRRKC